LTLILIFERLQVVLAFLEELTALKRSTDKLGLKEVPGPLNAMIQKVREVLKGAQRDPFLWRIGGISIGLGLEGNNDLRVALGSQGSRLEERFLVEYALGVNEFPSLQVI